MLEPRKRAADDKFFAYYHACVFLNRNVPGGAELRGTATRGPGARYLPLPRLLHALERAPDGNYFASVVYL